MPIKVISHVYLLYKNASMCTHKYIHVHVSVLRRVINTQIITIPPQTHGLRLSLVVCGCTTALQKLHSLVRKW